MPCLWCLCYRSSFHLVYFPGQIAGIDTVSIVAQPLTFCIEFEISICVSPCCVFSATEKFMSPSGAASALWDSNSKKVGSLTYCHCYVQLLVDTFISWYQLALRSLCKLLHFVKMGAKVGSAASTWARHQGGSIVCWYCWFLPWWRLAWFAFRIWVHLAGPLPALSESGLRLAILTIWYPVDSLFNIGGGFLFLLLNCQIISIRKFLLWVS